MKPRLLVRIERIKQEARNRLGRNVLNDCSSWLIRPPGSSSARGTRAPMHFYLHSMSFILGKLRSRGRQPAAGVVRDGFKRACHQSLLQLWSRGTCERRRSVSERRGHEIVFRGLPDKRIGIKSFPTRGKATSRLLQRIRKGCWTYQTCLSAKKTGS